MNANSWIGFDLDGTLAHYEGWKDGEIGKPIWPVVNILKHYLEQGIKCKIMTARVCNMRDEVECAQQRLKIRAWCQRYLGQELEMTHEKDFAMILLYDDRCIGVEQNTGKLLSSHEVHDKWQKTGG